MNELRPDVALCTWRCSKLELARDMFAPRVDAEPAVLLGVREAEDRGVREPYAAMVELETDAGRSRLVSDPFFVRSQLADLAIW